MLSVLLVACLALAVQSAVVDDDYPNVEVPGFAVPQFDDGDDDVNADPTPCCLPDVYQCNITVSGGSSGGGGRRRGPKFGAKNTKLYVDVKNKQVAGRSDARRGNQTEQRGFVFKSGANDTGDLYLFSLTREKCKHIHLPRAPFRPQCIPANATYAGSFTVGPKSGGLDVDSWFFAAKSPSDRRGGVFVAVYILVVKGTCNPVLVHDRVWIRRRPHSDGTSNAITFDQSDDDVSSSESEEEDPNRRPKPGKRGGEFTINTIFKNLETEIKDKDAFKPPSYCNATMPVLYNPLTYDDEPIPDVLDRFVMY